MAQSFGAFTAPLVCKRVPVELMVLVAGMVPVPGERGEELVHRQQRQLLADVVGISSGIPPAP